MKAWYLYINNPGDFLGVVRFEIFLKEYDLNEQKNIWILTSLQIHFILCLKDVFYVPSISGFEGYKDSVLNCRALGA